MSSNRLYRHYKQQLVSFKEYFDKSRERLKMEDIHQLRVSIKKIRISLTLMEVASWGGFRKRDHFSLFSKLFNVAGELREIQVNQSILNKIHLEEKQTDELIQSAIHFYRDDLAHQAQKSILRFNRTLRAFNFRKLKKYNKKLKGGVAYISDEIVVEESSAFVEKQIGKIKRLRVRGDSDYELHKIRMRLKSITETYRLNIKIFHDALLEQKIEPLKRLEALIGEWHDLMALIYSIESYLHKEEGLEFKQPLRKVVEDLSARGGEIKGEVIAHLDDLFN